MSQKKSQQQFRLQWQRGAWEVSDLDGVPLARVDQAIVDATQIEPKTVTGVILSSHGLEQELASGMSRQMLVELGVGAQARGFTPPPRHWSNQKRVRLLAGGRIDNV